MRELRKLIPVVTLFGTIAGLLFLTIGVYSLVHVALAQSWVEVRGTILSVNEVVLDMSLGKPGNAKSTASNVRYEYAYQGARFEYDRVYFHSPGSRTPFYYRRSVGKAYHVGDNVTVFVDPKDPSEVVLDRSALYPVLWLCAGLVLVAIWIVQLKYLPKSDVK